MLPRALQGVAVVPSANDLELQADLEALSLRLVRGQDLQPAYLGLDYLFRCEAYLHCLPSFLQSVMNDAGCSLENVLYMGHLPYV
jgi:hypothetical protein